MTQLITSVILLTCWMTLSQCRTTTTKAHKKREWPIKLCISDDDCDGGCCKGLFCFRYLSEGERCLFGHRLRVGCGCGETLECEKQSLPWDHICIKKQPPTISAEILNRELNTIVEEDRQNQENAEDHENDENEEKTKEKKEIESDTKSDDDKKATISSDVIHGNATTS